MPTKTKPIIEQSNIKLVEVIFNTPVLKAQLDVHLDNGGKINAIKALKHWCETTSYPAWLKEVSNKLRVLKDAVDKYDVRRIIYNKLTKLSERIELYCNKHGYDKMGSRQGAKSADGLYVHKYTDHELIEDHIKFTVNNLDWKPSLSEYKEYNKLWRRYAKK